MARHRNKRGLMAPQSARQISALDFAHASEAFDRALAVYRATSQDDDQEAYAIAIRVVDATAEALCGIPATDRASIAKKVAAAAWLSEDDAFDFADPAVVRRVAESGPEERHTKALLAIFLDLTVPEVDPNADLLAEMDTVLAFERAVQAGDRAVEREWDERCMAALKACDALPASRANVPAKLAGLRLIYENNGGLGVLERKSTDDRLLADIAVGLLS